MNEAKETKWIYGLDSLRFILAAWVLLGHLGSPFNLVFSYSDSELFKYSSLFFNNFFVGVAAVIAFFIISGIVIHFPYVKRELFPFEFLLKRYIRIGIPMLIIYFISVLLRRPESLWPFWSLYCELIYYSLYPFLYKISKRIGWTPIIISSFILCTFIVSFLTDSISNLINQNQINYIGNYHGLGIYLTWAVGLPAWLLGVSIAQRVVTSESNKSPLKLIQVLSIRIVILFLSVIASIARFHFNVSYLISLTILSLPISYWVFLEVEFFKKNAFTDLLERAGKWSYSLYICHSLVVSLLLSYNPDLNKNLIGWIMILFITFFVSYLFFKIVEYPSHKLAKKIRLR